jgi:hypothetical protein
MRSNVVKFLLSYKTRDVLAQRLINPINLKHLKVVKYEQSSATDIATLDYDIETCPSLDFLEVECIDISSGNRNPSLLHRDIVEEEPEKLEQVDTIVKDVSYIHPRLGILSLIGNFKMQSDYSAKYLMLKFPKLHELIIKTHSGLKIHNKSTKFSNNIMMDLLKYITTVPLVVEIVEIYMQNTCNFLVSFIQRSIFNGELKNILLF